MQAQRPLNHLNPRLHLLAADHVHLLRTAQAPAYESVAETSRTGRTKRQSPEVSRSVGA